MDLHLSGKRALVTGSTSGIGEQIAKTLANEGVRVIVHGRREAQINRVVQACHTACSRNGGKEMGSRHHDRQLPWTYARTSGRKLWNN